MAYTVKIGAFAKLENSTAQPASASWAEYSVTLKSGADFTDPVLSIAADFSVIYSCNYAVFLNRYYWITDIRVERTGYCIITLHCDVLATYKSTIGNSDLYVLRSSAASDGSIRDAFYPIKATSTKYRQVQTEVAPPGPFTVPPSYQYGVVVLYIAGVDTQSGTTMIEFSPQNFKALINALYTQVNGFQLDDVISQVVQYFGGNPQALISGAMWFPFPFDNAGLAPVKIGSWASNVYGAVVTDPATSMPDCTFSLYKHPQAAARGSYLNLSPYTLYTVGIPGAGVVSLDNTKLQDQTSIIIRREIDAFTGQMICKVDAGQSGQRLAVLTGQAGIPISLVGRNNADHIIGGALSTLGAGVAAVSGGAAAIAGAAAAGISAAADAIGGAGSINIVGGGAASIMHEPCWIDTICYDITDRDNSQEGSPLCQIRKPSNLGGYIRVADGYVEISGPLPEQQEIKRYLENGFFYE